MAKLSEAEIERQIVAEIFSLSGGELADEPLIGLAGDSFEFLRPFRRSYWYECAPEWATEDFTRDERLSCGDISTVITPGAFVGASKILVTGNETWLLEKEYVSDPERACPFAGEDDGSQQLVTDEHVALSEAGDRCPFCEAAIGEEHGFVYLGTCVEAVYRRLPLTAKKDGEKIVVESSDEYVKQEFFGWASDRSESEIRLYGQRLESGAWRWDLTPEAIVELFACFDLQAKEPDRFDMDDEELALAAKIRRVIRLAQGVEEA